LQTKSVLKEVLVIVLGVLIALGAQAWWSGRQDRDYEVTYLESLLRDLRTDSVEYDAVSIVLRRAQSYTLKSLAMVDGRSAAPSDPQGVSLPVFCASFLPIPVISRETLQDLLSTRALRLLRNRDLRAALLRYHSRVDAELQWVDEYRASQQNYRELLARVRLPELQVRAGGLLEPASLTASQNSDLMTRLVEIPDATTALNRMLFAQERMVRHVETLAAEALSLVPEVTEELELLTGRTPAITSTESASKYMVTSAICPGPVDRAL